MQVRAMGMLRAPVVVNFITVDDRSARGINMYMQHIMWGVFEWKKKDVSKINLSAEMPYDE